MFEGRIVILLCDIINRVSLEHLNISGNSRTSPIPLESRPSS
jgi:hypothetical protein